MLSLKYLRKVFFLVTTSISKLYDIVGLIQHDHPAGKLSLFFSYQFHVTSFKEYEYSYKSNNSCPCDNNLHKSEQYS